MFEERFLVFKDKKRLELRVSESSDSSHINQMVSEEDYFTPERLEREDRLRDRFRAERAERSAIALEFYTERDVNLSKRAADLLSVTGVTSAEAEKLLSEENNPYSIWLMNFLAEMPGNGWEIDLEQSKMKRKMLFKSKDGYTRNFKMADRIVQWNKLIYPKLLQMMEMWASGLEYENLDESVQKAVGDTLNYPGVETWIGMVSTGLEANERLELAAMIELLNLSGYDTSFQEEELTRLKAVSSVEGEKGTTPVSEDGNGEVYYGADGEPLSSEEVFRVEKNRRKETQNQLKRLQARTKKFGNALGDVKELEEDLDNFRENGMTDDDLEDFKGQVSDIFDKLQEKSEVVKRWRSLIEEIMVVVEQMSIDGSTQPQIQEYVNPRLAQVISEAKSALESGDDELKEEWSELMRLFENWYQSIMERYDVPRKSDLQGEEGDSQEVGGDSQESSSNSGDIDSGEGVPDTDLPPEGAVN
jgi:hypothetical protein